jgi:hypothetical protein
MKNIIEQYAEAFSGSGWTNFYYTKALEEFSKELLTEVVPDKAIIQKHICSEHCIFESIHGYNLAIDKIKENAKKIGL